ncbi:hypothetical protein C7W88_18100 (plasmid) [Novosphingobium sp. THN1]|nr:hypothetical protein C7W88_18100 [Novosphingobium sp. THN1]
MFEPNAKMRLRSALIVAMLGTCSVPALAQSQADPQAQTDQDALSSIVVYAQKKARGEELQKVPLAVTAVDGAAIERSHMVDIRDLGRLVPNAQLDGVGTFPGFANFFMRGVGVSTSVRSLDPAVNIVQDGMVIGYQAGAILDAFDMEGAEVLRGPQGVLFGRNASGGVVSVRSRRPDGSDDASVKVTLGNASTVEIRATGQTSLVQDKLFARVAVFTRNNDGFFINRNSGTFVTVPANANPTGAAAAMHREGRVQGANDQVVKGTLVFKPAQSTTLTLLGQYLHMNDGGGATRSYLLPNTALRQHQTVWGWTPDNGKWSVNLGDPGYTKIDGYHLIAELSQDIGTGTLTAIGAYRKIDYDATLNVSGDPFNVVLFPDNEESARQKSLELRYNISLNDTIDLLVGGFLFDLDTSVFEKRITRLATGSNRYTINRWQQSAQSYAAFGNIDWRPLGGLTLSAGVRYSFDRKKMHIVPLSNCPGQSFASCSFNYLDGQRSWDDVSPRFIANYEVASDVMVYASYSKGYRAGNFNARAPSAVGAVTPVDPETVGSFETGLKSQFLNRRVRLNVGYFRQKYDDIQRLTQIALPGDSPLQQLVNAAKATIQGVEVEASVVPVRGLRFDGTLGYIDAKYDRFDNLTGLAAGQAATDLKFDRVPKWTYSIGGSYDRDLGENAKLRLHAGYTWRSHVFTDLLNTKSLEQKAYGLLDAGASIDLGRWSIGVFGRNIANVEYAEIKSAGVGYNAFGGSPRYYGMELGWHF